MFIFRNRTHTKKPSESQISVHLLLKLFSLSPLNIFLKHSTFHSSSRNASILFSSSNLLLVPVRPPTLTKKNHCKLNVQRYKEGRITSFSIFVYIFENLFLLQATFSIFFLLWAISFKERKLK